ncbi:MAG: tRNA (adenosine(37)-N6)-threonylcarbamoyltransferase complex dimerization subunit type 1 TsaB [Planctomycetota bacterium]
MVCELAVEGSTRYPSVALRLPEGKVLSRRPAKTSQLVSSTSELLESCGLVPAQLGLVHVTLGPGAYTSLRVSLAFVQGLALSTGIRARAYDATEVLATTHVSGGAQGRFWIWNDARAGMILLRPYEVEAGRARPLGVTQCLPLAQAQDVVPASAVLVGSGPGATALLPEASALFVLADHGGGEDREALGLLPVYVREGVGR